MKNVKKGLCFIMLVVMILQATGCSRGKELSEADSVKVTAGKSVTEGNRSLSFPYIERKPPEDDYHLLVGKISELPEVTNGEIELRSADLSEADLSEELDKLLLSTYDSKTVWPELLPEGFDPEKLMELGKDPGLGVKDLHRDGITGKNIGIAIIDQVLLTEHEEYIKQLKYYSENVGTVTDIPAQMHGPAVASIAVGKTCGVAPEASLYYIAEDFIAENYTGRIADDIIELLELNKTLKEEEKIRVISISWGAEERESEGFKKLKEAYQRASEEGVFIITTSLPVGGRDDIKGIDFIGMAKSKLADANDFTAYGKAAWAESADCDLYGEGFLCIPMDNRCVAAHTGATDYAIYQSGGLSWSVPYIAGVYALACQVKPEINYNEFWKVALETAVANKELHSIINPKGIIDKLKEQK